MSYNPDYRPTGPNNRANEYYMKVNHVRIARNMASRSEFYGSPISVAPGGTSPSQFAYVESMRLDAHPDYIALTDIANWQSDGGAFIAQAVFLVEGVAGDAATIVQTGENVTLLVTDISVPANEYRYTIDASVSAFILVQPQPVDILEGGTAAFSLSAPTASAYMWEYSVNGTVWQQGFNSNLQLDYPDWTGTASDASVGETWQITDAHIDMNTMLVRCYLNGGAFITNEVALSVQEVVDAPIINLPAQVKFYTDGVLPHLLDVEDYNSGDPIASVTTVLGNPGAGGRVLYQNNPVNAVDTIVATNTGGSVQDTILVIIAPFVQVQPTPVTVSEGVTAVFTVSAPDASSRQWEYSPSGTNWKSATTANLRADYPAWTGDSAGATTSALSISLPDVSMTAMVVRCVFNSGEYVSNQVGLTVTDTVQAPNLTLPASLDYVVGVNTPHQIDIAPYNSGDPITSVTSQLGVVTGTTVIYPDAVLNGTDTIVASNTGGSDQGTIMISITAAPVADTLTLVDNGDETFTVTQLPKPELVLIDNGDETFTIERIA